MYVPAAIRPHSTSADFYEHQLPFTMMGIKSDPTPRYAGVIVDNNCNIISETRNWGSDWPTEMCHSGSTGRPYSGRAYVSCSADNA